VLTLLGLAMCKYYESCADFSKVLALIILSVLYACCYPKWRVPTNRPAGVRAEWHRDQSDQGSSSIPRKKKPSVKMSQVTFQRRPIARAIHIRVQQCSVVCTQIRYAATASSRYYRSSLQSPLNET
jgi:hypothetical protein